MNNIISYYYGFNNVKVYRLNDKYYFNYNNDIYFFLNIMMPLNIIDNVKKIYSELISKNIFTNKIVLNTQGQMITMLNNESYVLVKDETNGKKISINDILFLQNNTFNILNNRDNISTKWINLWSQKIDNYEFQFKEISGKYKLLSESIYYYIGLGENAISYLVNNKISINSSVVSHRRIDCFMNSFDFYNPINYILDSRVRDFSEYIKSMFFHEDISFNSIMNYLNYLNFNREEYILFISRLLFPTYFFDIYDDIVGNGSSEETIKKILNKNDDYISFLKNIFYFIIYTKRVNIPVIEWIINYC